MNNTWKSFKKESKSNWGRTMPINQDPNNDELMLGAVCRIATALESILRTLREISKSIDK